MMTRTRRAGALAIALGAASTGQAQAADGTTVKLIELLVKNGVLTRTQATALLHEAQSEAAGPGPARHRRLVAQGSVTTTPPAAVAGEPGAGGPGTGGPGAGGPGAPVHVTYVPPMVRDEIASEVKQQVMQEAQQESWAQGGTAIGNSSWTSRVRVSGDIRLRGEENFLPGALPVNSSGNYSSSASGNYPFFTNFNAINRATNGFDTNGNSNPNALPPLLNTIENRSEYRIRARINVAAQVADWIDADVRIATGNDANPVSTNQTLGANGYFAKYALWLDLGYLHAHPTEWFDAYAGRMPNPFWTSNLLFYDELSFDGVAIQLHHPITSGVDGFFTAGGFPVFNTSFDFGTTTNTSSQLASHDAWLLAVQGGFAWRINHDYRAKLGVGFFDFAGVQGAKSAPCVDPQALGACSTDNTNTDNYEQFGNTLMPLRTIVPNPALTDPADTPVPEIYGLSSRFEVFDARGEVKLVHYSPVDVTLMGDFVKNFGFNRNAIASSISDLEGADTTDAVFEATNARYANNFGASTTAGGAQPFVGGNTAYDVALSVGHDKVEHLWDWSLSVAYKYIETDALLDALTDPNFHLGGTNAKGYIINGNIGLAHNTYLSTTWYSATQVSGAPYSNDVLFVDLNAKF